MSNTRQGSPDARSVRERMRAGDPSIADDPHLAAHRMRGAKLTHQFNTSAPNGPNTRGDFTNAPAPTGPSRS